MDYLLIGRNPCTKFGIDQVKGSKDIEETTHWAQNNGLTFNFENVTWNSIGIINSLGEPHIDVWYWSSEGVKRYWAHNTLSSKERFDLELWTWRPIKSIGIIYSLRAALAPTVVLIKKILSGQHTGLKKSCLTLIFEHGRPQKSIGIIYSLGATPAPSLVLIKWRGQDI